MLRYIDSKQMGRSRLRWLDSHFHFSFAEYFNPDNIQFGVLRVINDDLVQPDTGFDKHPHDNMEIISYVVDGELTHGDSMQNRQTLTRGQVQYMSAGTGVMHSEHNFGDKVLRFLQIWIFPDKRDYPPAYGDYRFKWEDRLNRWMPVASGDGKPEFPIGIHADVHMYATELEKGKNLPFAVAEDRQAYLVLIEGKAKIGDIEMKERDALEIIGEDIDIQAAENAHMLIIEMKKASS